MELSRYKVKLSKEEQIAELENLKVTLGWMVMYNYLADQIEKNGEVVLDDMIEEKLTDKERKELAILRWMQKQMVNLPDKIISDLTTPADREGEVPDYDPY